MQPLATAIQRDGRSAVVRLRGDLVVPAVGGLYTTLRTVARRREVRTLVLDFSGAGRIDSSGIAVVALIGRQLARQGKQLDLSCMQDQHRAALALAPELTEEPAESVATAGSLERAGERVLDLVAGVRTFGGLVGQTVRQLAAVATRRSRMPAGALRHQIEAMGVGAIFIVGLLSFLTGMTMAFQGAVQLQRFGAGVFVADMIGMSMVRELVPLMTAVIITGRTGAAIAAELGTMQVRSEIDALSTMGIDPVRFLIVPRILAITLIGPALTLIGIFIGILGGMLVAAVTLDMPAVTFWARVVDRVTLLDFAHGLGKSLVFAWIIGLAGSHLGMRAGGDASSVGTATTRTVVVSVFFIIVVDALFATITTFARHG
jgi:phospholipid/cholesterol/gamma-HCH transport system permease protein